MAKRGILVVLFSCLVHMSVLAFAGFPPPHTIYTDTLDVEIPDTAWQMLEDPTGTLTIDQVSQPPMSNKFHFDSTYRNGIGFSIHTYWMRLRLRNGMARRADIILYQQYADKIDYFFKYADGSEHHQSIGALFATTN